MNLECYPPVFCHQNTATQNTHDLDDTTKEHEEFDPLPTIDLQRLNMDKLGQACKDWGMFRLVNHGVPLTLLSQLQDRAKSLFSFSFESKQALFTRPVSYFWGTPALTPSGSPICPQNSSNWVEGFNIPLNQLSQFQTSDDPMLDDFRFLLEEYGKHLGRIATTIFQAAANALNLILDPNDHNTYLSESTAFIRVYRYPPAQCSSMSRAKELWGLDVHTDSSVLSILSQNQVAGLQVFKDHKWFLVKPILNTLILNVGDMMQAISNDEYKSVKHRVKVHEDMERVSICYFVFPAEGSVIQSSHYKPFTYSDFQAQVQQDIKTLGFKVGLDRFKLTNCEN